MKEVMEVTDGKPLESLVHEWPGSRQHQWEGMMVDFGEIASNDAAKDPGHS
jgi:hypothetical protein